MAALEFCQVRDEETAQTWHAVDAATRPPDLPADPVCEVLPKLRQPPESGERFELWLGVRGGAAVAAAELMLPTLDNLENATLDVRVLPPERRQGAGSALLAHLLDRVREGGRTRVFGEIEESLDGGAGDSGESGRSLARRFGARPVLTEIRRVLDVAGLD